MSFLDQAFEESPSRTTEPAPYAQSREEQQSSQAQQDSVSSNDMGQSGNPGAASDHHSENLRHSGGQGASGVPGHKQETHMEDFATVLENFEAAQTEAMAAMENKILSGTVLKLTSSYLVVDIGGKSEGMVPIAEALDAEGNPKFKPGDELAVMVEHGETEEGYPKLSHVKAQRLQSIEAIEKAYNEKSTIKGRIVERVKGGLSVDLDGAVAFLPGSQVDVKPAHNLDAMKGQEIEVRVIKLNRKRGNIVVSRKAILDEIVADQRSKTLEKLYEGADLTGTVKNLTDYGAFVDLGGIDGLLHITDMSWGRLTHPRDLVHVGDEIHVKVLKFDKEKQRVSLGFKQLTPDPWLDAAERYPVGAHVKGRVISVTDYGAFIELEQGIEGLVHVSEMSWSKRMKHPSKLVKINDQLETVVLNVNAAERRISLGLKQLESNPWDTLHEKYPTGMIVEGKVRNLTEFGAFVEVEEGIDGLVYVSNMSWTKRVKHPSEVLKKGEKVRAVILAIEPEHRRLSLGIKQLQPDAWQSFFDTHKIGDVVHGKVLRTAQFGAFVQISEGVEALCHNSESVDEHGSPIKLEPGIEHDFKIVKMNPEEKKVGLSLRGIGAEASRADVEAYKQPVSSSGATATLGEMMSLKRASNDQN